VRNDHGSTVVEAILVIPILMLVLVVVIQCALWARADQVVGLAASDGDRTARSIDGGVAAGTAQARSIFGSSDRVVVSSDVAVEVMSGDLVRMTVTGRATSIVPGLTLPVSSVVVGPMQEFRGGE
jgi:hypothetical protein